MEILGLNQFSLPEMLHPLVYIGLLLLLSYAGGKVASYLKVPRISGYIAIGMLISPSVLGLFHERLVKEELALITDIALAIIAFSIGGSLRMSKLTGVISLGVLSRHVFSPSHEPQIHPRFLISMITAKKAKDIMQKNTVVATEGEKLKQVLKRMIRTGVEDIPVLDKEKRIIADLTLADLLRFVVNSNEH